MTSFFADVTTLEELKREYRRLAFAHHPDCGGDTATMQQINNEYERLFEQVKHTHKNRENEYYTKETAETPEEWQEIVTKLLQIQMKGVVIEVIGSFLWISGNTKPYKEQLKESGMKWSKNKAAWYLSPEGYKRHGKKLFSMDEIRGMYSSQVVREENESKLNRALHR